MLTLRQATTNDLELLLAWRNDPRTRGASHDSSVVSREQHEKWLAASLVNSKRLIYIVEDDLRPVGTVRVDRGDDGTSELSWTVAPVARGQGFAASMVRMVADIVVRKASIRAEVKVGNGASARVAEAAGMRLISRERGVLHFYREASTR